jgi:cytidylate kinase
MDNQFSTLDYSSKADLDRCHAYLLSQSKRKDQRPSGLPGPGPAITVSSLTGAGEHEVAKRVAGLFEATATGNSTPWTVFDRNLIEKVLEEHYLPTTMARFISEDRRSFIEEVLEEIMGLHPPSWVMVPQIIETVLQLADAGHVILVGRGASFITARMENVFHARLVAPLESRIERVSRIENLPVREAAKFVAEHDRGRKRFARAYFHSRPDDDLLYHLVINTDRIPCPAAAQLIAQQARKFFQASAEKSIVPAMDYEL